MGTAEDHDDLQSAIDFFATPLIVDVMRAIRDGRSPSHTPGLDQYGDAVDAAVAVLTNAGAVAGSQRGDEHPGQSLMLTKKGRQVCALIDEVIDFYVPIPLVNQPPERVTAGRPDRTVI